MSIADNVGVLESFRSRGLQQKSLKVRPVVLFLVSDVTAMVLASVFAVFATPMIAELMGMPGAVLGTGMLAIYATLLMAIFALSGLYARSGWEADELRSIILGVAVVAFFSIATQLLPGSPMTLICTLLVWPVAAFLIAAFRMMARLLPLGASALDQDIVLIGRGIAADDLKLQFQESRSSNFRVTHQISIEQLDNLSGAELAVRLAELSTQSWDDNHEIEFVFAPDFDEMEKTDRMLRRMSEIGQTYSVALPFGDLARRGARMRNVLGGDVVLAETSVSSREPLARSLKRVLDILIAGAALIVISPVMMVVSVLIARDGGSIFYKQKRVGRGRVRFECFKFRTMAQDAEAQLTNYLAANADARMEWAKHQKLEHDPRITRVGRLLRKFSLDELPQLINVLRGEMSIVGPRPIVAPEIKGYDGDLNYYNSPEFEGYAQMAPGITGLWQVSGRAFTPHTERVRLDQWYSRNWSFWLDLAIIMKTVKAAVFGTGR